MSVALIVTGLFRDTVGDDDSNGRAPSGKGIPIADLSPDASETRLTCAKIRPPAGLTKTRSTPFVG
jgi:hypothetical protein